MEEAICFGTDGWRAIIGEGFTEANLVRVVEAAAKAFIEECRASNTLKRGSTETSRTSETATPTAPTAPTTPTAPTAPTLIVGHDCRKDAHRYAALAAQVAASYGFTVKLSQDYCPTPALCWSIAQDAAAVGGIMLTSSHNPAEYLGVKLRMADGGASPKEFTDRVEALLEKAPTEARGEFEEADIVSPYLAALKKSVDVEAIRAAQLRVVVDPLFGAGRKYLAALLEEMGVEVAEVNNADDPSFDGLHPEPIPPWIDRGAALTRELGYDAGFITDGDADRIGAIDDQGNFVNPHRIITLLVAHLVEDKGLRGRVVTTCTASALLTRQCKRLRLDLTTTPVGFKWIYGEMEKGDVMIGGEESGGIGIPSHVKERDGLLMALLLAETMAQKKMSLRELVEDMFQKIGRLEFARRGLEISEEQMRKFRTEVITHYEEEVFCGKPVMQIDRRDGIKLCFEDDSWVMMRPSGTEPLVRIYAEATTAKEVEELLDAAEKIVKG